MLNEIDKIQADLELLKDRTHYDSNVMIKMQTEDLLIKALDIKRILKEMHADQMYIKKIQSIINQIEQFLLDLEDMIDLNI